MPRKTKPAKKVLLLDNDPHSRETHGSLLQQSGCVVDTVETGQAILDKLAIGIRYDIIIMDLHLPDMTVIEALWEIRRGQIRVGAGKLVVLFSCELLSDMATDFVILGVTDVMRKPQFAKYFDEVLE